MRAAGLLLLIAGGSLAQVYNAADVNVGSSTTVLAPGARAVVNYFEYSGSAGAAMVSLLPVNSTTPYPAQVLSQSPIGITFVVPPDVPLGPAQLIYKPGGQATQWTSVNIVPASFLLYRTGPAGPLIAPIIDLKGSGVASGLTRPAQLGFGVELFGSGLGATPQSQIHITLGGVPQQVTYAGAPPQMPGINQIDFLVAAGTPDGCYVPLVVTYASQSVSSFLSKTSDGQPCHHPWGLSQQALTTLDNGNSVETGEVQLTTGIQAATSNRASRQESAQLVQTAMNAGQIASSFVAISGHAAQPCSLVSSFGIAYSTFGGSATFGTGQQLTNAAGTIALPYTSPQATDSPLNNLPPPAIAAGFSKFSETTPAVLPAGMSFSFTLPPPIQLSGGAPVTINRAKDTTIAWNGAGYDAFATLQLSLTSAFAPGLSCTVPAQAGSVTIPANLLTSFVPGSAGVLSVSLSENGPGIPSADFVHSATPELVLAIWSSTDARPVDFQ